MQNCAPMINKDCFKFVLEKNNLQLHETLFIDDSIQHIEGAMTLGLSTYLLKPGEELTKVVPDIIL